MADITLLTYPYFSDNDTPLDAAHLNPIVQKINQLVQAVNGAQPVVPITDITSSATFNTAKCGIKKDNGLVVAASNAPSYVLVSVDVSSYAGKTLVFTNPVTTSETMKPYGAGLYEGSTYLPNTATGVHTGQPEMGVEEVETLIPSGATLFKLTWFNASGIGAEFSSQLSIKVKG